MRSFFLVVCKITSLGFVFPLRAIFVTHCWGLLWHIFGVWQPLRVSGVTMPGITI